MKLEELLAKNLKASDKVRVTMISEKKGLKGIKFIKSSTLDAQFGVNYEDIEGVKEKLQERLEQGIERRPSWFENTDYVGVVQNKKDPSKKYIKLANPSAGSATYKLEDGTNVTKQDLIKMGAIKEKDSEGSNFLLCSLDNLVNIEVID